MNKKDIILKLEQIYHNSIDNLPSDEDTWNDVPTVDDDKEYKTNIVFPPMQEDIEEPELKTKKGKNILREPPEDNPEDYEPEDLEMLDNKGKEIKNWEKDKSEKVVSEAKDEEKDQEDDDNGMGDLAQANMGEQNPETGQDPNADQGTENPNPQQITAGTQQDPTQMGAVGSGMGMDQMGAATGGQDIDPMTGQPKKDAEQVGRIYELKKIYSRLLAIESQLSFSSDLKLVKLRGYISKAVELFETLISNIDAFLEDIDDIIVVFYNFLNKVYDILKKYYMSTSQDEQIKKNNKIVP